jgi:Arc/MetJ-type ribon-helix-helix transcriptional regulator
MVTANALGHMSHQWYDSAMAMRKVSVTLDGEMVDEARALVGSRGLSSYVNSALRLKLQHDRIGRLLDELESEAGPIPDDVMDEVRREWPADAKSRRRRA